VNPDDDFRLAAIIRCHRCAELVADVYLRQVYDEDDVAADPAVFVPVLRRQIEPGDVAFVIGLNNGTRRLTRCRCEVQPCTIPEHILTGQKPARRVDVADTEALILEEIPADSIEAWCNRCRARTVDLRTVRRRIARTPGPDGTTPLVKLRTINRRHPTRR